jgi:two-component system LytT family response regulator
MEVLIVQSQQDFENRIPDFEDHGAKGRFRRVFSVKEAVESIQISPPELVIVDVDIENGAGFGVFEATKDVTYEKIILTEAAHRPVKSIRYDVVLHLRKPLQPQELHHALLSFLFKRQKHSIQRLFNEKFNSTNQVRLSKVFLCTSKGIQLIKVDSIENVEELGYLRRMSMNDGSTVDATDSMSRLRMLLRGNGFVLTHASILLQAEKVLKISNFNGQSMALMRMGRRVSLSYLDECRIRAFWKRSKSGIR